MVSAVITSDLNLDLCAQEPLRTPGLIQPHGMLVVVDPDSQQIAQASANASALLGDDRRASVLGSSLRDVIGSSAERQITQWLRTADSKRLQVLGHQTAQGIILEFEQPPASEGETLEAYCHNTSVLANAAPTQFECRFNCNHGETRWLSWSAAPGHGCIYAIGRDITEDKAAQAQLEQAQEALRQAQKMEAVGQLTGGLAHDFNNLLQIIVGNIETLQRKLPTDLQRLRRAADHAMAGAQRATNLTQHLLAFSRKQPLNPRPVAVNRLVLGMSQMLQRTLGELIEIQTSLASELRHVDDADVRAFTIETVRELGYDVLEARDGNSALNVLRQTPAGKIDLLFSDVVLPGGINGQQLAQQALELHPHLKVLFATGYARDVIVHHGRLDPGVQLITKPFAFGDLAARLRSVLDGQDSRHVN